jgi:hypothetical protein
VDRAYPAGNKAVLDYIASHGLVVSELPPGCAPTKLRFLSRNRLIAALARGTVVVEAAVRSGALSTANWASRTGRVLMGVPGPVTSAPSEGVHELIRTGEAGAVRPGGEHPDRGGAPRHRRPGPAAGLLEREPAPEGTNVERGHVVVPQPRRVDQHAGDVAEVGAHGVRRQVALGDQVPLVVGEHLHHRLGQRLLGVGHPPRLRPGWTSPG